MNKLLIINNNFYKLKAIKINNKFSKKIKLIIYKLQMMKQSKTKFN